MHLTRILICINLVLGMITQAAAQTTAFTYQGRLTDNGSPANGIFDLQFRLFDSANSGAQLGATLSNDLSAVSNGLFVVVLDFGEAVFTGPARWLEIAVRTNGAGAFLVLNPRQPLTSTPHAIFAAHARSSTTASNAAIAESVAPGAITETGIVDGAITASKIPVGHVVKSINGLRDHVSFIAGVGLQLDGTLFSVNFGGTGASNLTARSDHHHDSVYAPLTHLHTAAEITSGTLVDALLSPNVALLSADQTFNGSNFFGGILNATNAANQLGGFFIGDGLGLTNLNANALSSGVIPEARIDSAIARDSEIVPALLAADGPASGLDADLIDGLDSTAFAPASGSVVYLNKSGDTMTGRLTLPLNGLAVGSNQLVLEGGHAGIGKNNPAFPLDVNGIVNATSFYQNGTAFNPSQWISSGTNISFSGGKVSIGVTNPSFGTFDVMTPRGSRMMFELNEGELYISGRNARIQLGGGSSGAYMAYGGGNKLWAAGVSGNDNWPVPMGTFFIHDNSVPGPPRLVIDGGGNVGIGTTTPGATLDVNGTLKANSFTGIGTNLSGLWKLGGNSGTSPGSTFLGTVDNQPLEMRVNNQRAARIEHATHASFGFSPNILLGSSANTVSAGRYGATIGGGGTISFPHVVNGNFATIAGGFGNTATGEAPTVGGGAENVANGYYAVVPGGRRNTALEICSFAAGNQAKALHAGTFVWSDYRGTDFASTASDQFLIRAGGGVGINRNNPATALDVAGTVTATAFSGSGAGLTALNASNITVGVLAETRLSPNVALLGNHQVFTGSNQFSGVLSATNTANKFAGVFVGEGSSLINLDANNLTLGSIADARLSTNVAKLGNHQVFTGSNKFSGVLSATNAANKFAGVFVGEGSSLINLDANNLTQGSIADGRLSPNVAMLGNHQVFTGSNKFSGVLSATNAANKFAGVFMGEGSSLMNLDANNLTLGSIADARLSTNVAKLASSPTFTGTVTAPSFAGRFTGDGAGLTNVGGFSWQVVNGTSQQAQPDTGYILAQEALTTVTLPTNPQIGDVVRISGGAGGWQIAQNDGQTILPIPFAGFFTNWDGLLTNWNVAMAIGGDSFTSIACSADGSKWVGVTLQGRSYNEAGSPLAFDSGLSVAWTSVASSADGEKLVATQSPGGIFVSTNGGLTVMQTTAINQSWSSVASSSNGVKLVAAANANASFEPGSIYTSANSGGTWTKTAAPSNSWSAVASSADGVRLYATSAANVAGNPGSIYTSANSGGTWTKTTAPSNAWQSVACSLDGTRVVASISTGDGAALYTSVNSGTSWTTTSPAGFWDSVASSGDGKRFVAVERLSPFRIIISTNSGTNWVQATAPSRQWGAVASSADGRTLLASTQGGSTRYLYKAHANQLPITTTPGTDGYISGGPYSAVELQYIGNGRFLPLSHQGTIAKF